MSDVTELRDDAVDAYAAALAACAFEIVRGDLDAALSALGPIAGERWRVALRSRREAPRGERAPARPPVSQMLTGAMLRRDGMRCAHCGGRAVPRGVLVALSDVFPDALPYDRHYRSGRMHPAYWVLVAEADHRIAHSAGGSSELENLETLHALCNTMKSDSVAGERRTHASGAESRYWDGLVGSYPWIFAAGELRGRRHSTDPRYHLRWMRALGVEPLPSVRS